MGEVEEAIEEVGEEAFEPIINRNLLFTRLIYESTMTGFCYGKN